MSLNKKVQFLVVGAQKSGTSALDVYMRQHTELQMAERKEAHFFDTDNIFKKSPVKYHNYHSLFGKPTDKLWGECTPNYMYWHNAMKRIYEYNPEVKIIAVLRNPLERAYSAWNMERVRGIENLSFGEAIRTESIRCRSNLPSQHRHFSYLDRGFYTEQLRRIWRYFSESQTLIIKYEDFNQNKNDCLVKVAAFLNVGVFTNIKYEHVNANAYKSAMSITDRNYLKDIYQHEVKQLETMLDWNCDSWLSAN